MLKRLSFLALSAFLLIIFFLITTNKRAKEAKEKYYYSEFEDTILNLLGDMIIEHHDYSPDSLTMLVKNVNAKIDGRGLSDYLREELENAGFDDVSFTYGDGHWMTVHNYQ